MVGSVDSLSINKVAVKFFSFSLFLLGTFSPMRMTLYQVSIRSASASSKFPFPPLRVLTPAVQSDHVPLCRTSPPLASAGDGLRPYRLEWSNVGLLHRKLFGIVHIFFPFVSRSPRRRTSFHLGGGLTVLNISFLFPSLPWPTFFSGVPVMHSLIPQTRFWLVSS